MNRLPDGFVNKELRIRVPYHIPRVMSHIRGKFFITILVRVTRKIPTAPNELGDPGAPFSRVHDDEKYGSVLPCHAKHAPPLGTRLPEACPAL